MDSFRNAKILRLRKSHYKPLQWILPVPLPQPCPFSRE